MWTDEATVVRELPNCFSKLGNPLLPSESELATSCPQQDFNLESVISGGLFLSPSLMHVNESARVPGQLVTEDCSIHPFTPATFTELRKSSQSGCSSFLECCSIFDKESIVPLRLTIGADHAARIVMTPSGAKQVNEKVALSRDMRDDASEAIHIQSQSRLLASSTGAICDSHNDAGCDASRRAYHRYGSVTSSAVFQRDCHVLPSDATRCICQSSEIGGHQMVQW